MKCYLEKIFSNFDGNQNRLFQVLLNQFSRFQGGEHFFGFLELFLLSRGDSEVPEEGLFPFSSKSEKKLSDIAFSRSRR